MKKMGVPMLLLLAIGIAAPAFTQQPVTFIQFATDTSTLNVPGITTSLRPALSDNRFRFRAITLPVSLIAYGFVALENDGLQHLNASTKAELREDHPSFITHADNYLQFTPAVAVYALNMAGIKGEHNLRDRSVIYGMTMLLSTAVVFPLKKITNEERPDHSDFRSFPSGHTTLAFASAEFLRQEYKEVSPWYGVAGYAVATTTGALRMYNNKHWLSDVVAGAGLGILSTKAIYWIYPWVQRKIFKEKPVTTLVMPYYQNSGAGLALVHHFQ